MSCEIRRNRPPLCLNEGRIVNGERISELLDRGTLLGQVFTPVRGTNAPFLQSALRIYGRSPEGAGLRIQVRDLKGSVMTLTEWSPLLRSRRRCWCQNPP